MQLTQKNIEIYLTNEHFPKVFRLLLSHSEEIWKLYDSEYYNTLTDEEVSFLDDINYIKDFSPSNKLKLFNFYLEIVSVQLFSKVVKRDIDLPLKSISLLNTNPNLKNSLIKLENEIPEVTIQDILDILCEIYPLFVNSVSRKNSGSEYTSPPIVNFMLDEIEYNTQNIVDKKLLDPSCGSGAFILAALERYIKLSQESKREILNKLLFENILVGIDINPINVIITKLRFVLKILQSLELDNEEIRLLIKDLPIKEGNTLSTNSLLKENSSLIIDNYYDFVIGNPPYIRLHRLSPDVKSEIKEKYQSATGRFDLYVCFMEKSVNLLKDGGKVSLITSNKYLTANYGKGIRNFLLEQTQILHLIDLHDTEFFGAAVLPAIITGEKTNSNKNGFVYSSVKKSNNKEINGEKVDNVFPIIQTLKRENIFNTMQLIVDTTKKDVLVELSHSAVELPKKDKQWNFSSSSEDKLKRYLEQLDHYFLNEIADVCVGIKPNPNTVFVDPMTKEFVNQRKFEAEIIHPILRKDNVSRWNITWNGDSDKDRYVLYPHTMENGKGRAIDLDSYPKVKEYLYENEATLKDRDYLINSKTRKWFEIWVPHDLDKFSKPKIVTRDISERSNFAIDYNGYICLGSLFFINLKDNFSNERLSETEFLQYLLGLCNSNVLEFYQKTISGSLYSKKVRYTSTNLNRWIIPQISNENLEIIRNIIDIVQYIDEHGVNDIKHQEILLNEEVYKLFKLNASQIDEIENYIKTNS